MAPRKNRPVLFEVISRTQRSRPPKVNLPRPAASSGPPAPGAGPTPGPAPSQSSAGSSSSDPPPAKPTMVTKFRTSGITTARSLRGCGGGGPPSRRSPWLTLSENGRVHFSLGWQELVIAGVVALVLAAGIFFLGRRTGYASTASPTPGLPPVENPGLWDSSPPAPVQQEPARKPVEPLPGQNRSARVDTPRGPSDAPPPLVTDQRPSPPPPVPQRDEPRTADVDFQPQEGAYYVVAQHFPPRYRKQAEEARDFLRGKGLNAVVRTGDRDLELVLTDAFASEQQASAAVQRVRELGKEFRKAGGGYDLAGVRARKH